MGLPPHERVLPALDVTEEGLRQLELWLVDRLRALFTDDDTAFVRFNDPNTTLPSRYLDVTTNTGNPGGYHFRFRGLNDAGAEVSTTGSNLLLRGPAGAKLDGNADVETGNSITISPSSNTVTQTVKVHIQQGFFEIDRALTDIIAYRVSDTGYHEWHGPSFGFDDGASHNFLSMLSGTGAGTGTQFDLRNGSTLTVNDHNGSPIFQLTG